MPLLSSAPECGQKWKLLKSIDNSNKGEDPRSKASGMAGSPATANSSSGDGGEVQGSSALSQQHACCMLSMTELISPQGCHDPTFGGTMVPTLALPRPLEAPKEGPEASPLPLPWWQGRHFKHTAKMFSEQSSIQRHSFVELMQWDINSIRFSRFSCSCADETCPGGGRLDVQVLAARCCGLLVPWLLQHNETNPRGIALAKLFFISGLWWTSKMSFSHFSQMASQPSSPNGCPQA